VGPALLIVGILAIGLIGAYLAWQAEQKHRAAMQALADELGLHYQPEPDAGHDDEYAQFEIFRRGHSRVAMHTLSGAVELFDRPCAVRAGDFRYKVTSSNGKTSSTRTYRFSYLIVHPPWPSPTLLVRREGMFDKMKAAFGFDDIDFESAEFSKRFFVTSSDKRFAYDVLHPRMIEFLLAAEPLTLDLEGGALCISDGARRWQPDDYRQQLAFVREFCSHWPRHLLQDLEK
jgi:hypothetical protein